MQLSIIVPIHNEISYISKSFESIILAGSEIESEFFFVDGQSNDGTYEWIEKAIKKLIIVDLFWMIKNLLVMALIWSLMIQRVNLFLGLMAYNLPKVLFFWCNGYF